MSEPSFQELADRMRANQAPAGGYTPAPGAVQHGKPGSLGTQIGLDTAAASGDPSALGILAGAGTGYQQIQGFQNLVKGKPTSMLQEVAMFPITGGLSLARRFFGGGTTDRDTLRRRAVLGDLENSPMGKNPGITDTSGAQRFLAQADYNVQDFTKDGDTVANVNPLAFIIGKNRDYSDKDITDLAGRFSNMVRDDDPTKAIENARSLYKQWGMTPDQVRNEIGMLKDKGIDDNTLNVFRGAIARLQRPVTSQPGSTSPAPAYSSPPPLLIPNYAPPGGAMPGQPTSAAEAFLRATRNG